MREEKKKNNYLPTACCNILYGFLFAILVIFQQPAHSADTDDSVSVFALVNTDKSQATYQVRRSDSLLTIAKRLKPADVHYYQVAAALWLKNPAAFTNNNPNKLKANKRLLVPTSEEIHANSLREASQAINSGIPLTRKVTRHAQVNYIAAALEQKIHVNAHKKIPTPNTVASEPDKKSSVPSPFEQKLRDALNAINIKVRNLEQQIPTPSVQKQAQMQHLESLHDLQQQQAIAVLSLCSLCWLRSRWEFLLAT